MGVSWNEAAAYANWLSKKTGEDYRLPTEAQWEKAARGTKGWIYPWGNEFDKNLCNSDECGLDRTSPVGIFPGGESPYGSMDMAGNVWEWCADWYDEKYYHKSPPRIQVGPLQAPHEYFGEVVGLIKRGLVLQQFVTMPGLTTAAKTLDFVLPDHF